ncbi:hypothetical protein CEXT_172811 [Caerostris extrusa]|uniref:Uncharacterized protein n=1 Tax=Caerostris extrusa TaxID=172846 RepID=A0AAV4Q3X8_CAEEX|nr:hypothetical protein CEXT_172811 [Caerostris extrusa]
MVVRLQILDCESAEDDIRELKVKRCGELREVSDAVMSLISKMFGWPNFKAWLDNCTYFYRRIKCWQLCVIALANVWLVTVIGESTWAGLLVCQAATRRSTIGNGSWCLVKCGNFTKCTLYACI